MAMFRSVSSASSTKPRRRRPLAKCSSEPVQIVAAAGKLTVAARPRGSTCAAATPHLSPPASHLQLHTRTQGYNQLHSRSDVKAVVHIDQLMQAGMLGHHSSMTVGQQVRVACQWHIDSS